MIKPRKRCDYPLSDFYNFEDEVPYGTRVSTTQDCAGCDTPNEFCLDTGHCLIEDNITLPHPCPDE